MNIKYKQGIQKKPAFLSTHFLYRERTKEHKINISSYKHSDIDDIIMQNCIDEMSSNKRNTHSVKVLYENFIQKDPLKTFSKFTAQNVIDFFDYIKITETQKIVLQGICYFIQLIPYNEQFQELVLRLDFYSNIKRLIEPPIKDDVQELALWCVVYSLDLNMDFRKCLFDNEIYDTLINYNENYYETGTSYSEYIRGKFFRVATSYSDEMGEIILEKIIGFLVNVIKKIASQNQVSHHLFLSKCIIALKNTFNSGNYAFELIDSNNLQQLFLSLLFEKKEPKLRINAAKTIYELVQSMLFSSEMIVDLNLMVCLFQTSTFNDAHLFSICMMIMKEILLNPESFELDIIIETLNDFDLSKCFADCCNFEIKIEMLSVIPLLVFNSTPELMSNIFSPEGVEFFCDLINAGHCGVSSDVVHIFNIAIDNQNDPSFVEMINDVLIDSGAYDQLIMQMDDPDNYQDEVDCINAFVHLLKPPEK